MEHVHNKQFNGVNSIVPSIVTSGGSHANVVVSKNNTKTIFTYRKLADAFVWATTPEI